MITTTTPSASPSSSSSSSLPSSPIIIIIIPLISPHPGIATISPELTLFCGVSCVLSARHLEGCYVDYDEFLTCLRKLGITPPPFAASTPPPRQTPPQEQETRPPQQ
jgi:hypothetical protein